MKIENPQAPDMTPGLKRSLTEYRRRRKFRPTPYIEAKSEALNAYMTKHGLKGCVIGLSGGIDSTVALYTLIHASIQPYSPIERIVGLSFTADSTGVTRQDTITDNVTLLERELEAFIIQGQVDIEKIDFTNELKAVKRLVDNRFIVWDLPTDWAEGQLAATLRTPMFYYTTSVLAETGVPSVVIGTINRDEGAYMGYVGKASDGMVDIQLISDLHKSEVRKLAEWFHVPRPIIDQAPSPDMHDGRTDEELFGAPYDFVELFIANLTKGLSNNRLWTPEDREAFQRLSRNVRKVHQYNAHKYLVGDPAVHLDVLESAVPGGWQKPNDDFPVTQRFVNPVELHMPVHAMNGNVLSTPVLKGTKLHGLLLPAEVENIAKMVKDQKWVYTGLDGRALTDPAATLVRDIFSARLSVYSELMADVLWDRMEGIIPKLMSSNNLYTTDCDGSWWRAVGINPLFRFIHYAGWFDGALVPHYDAPYEYGPNKRTLRSLVIGLEVGDGCGTRFLKDDRADESVVHRDLSDRFDMEVTADDILETVTLSEGDALVFDHRLLHDSEPIPRGTSKLIVRSDIVYERVGSRG